MKTGQYFNLTEKDALDVICLINLINSCGNESEVSKVMESLKRLFTFEGFYFSLERVDSNYQIIPESETVVKMIPDNCLESIKTQKSFFGESQVDESVESDCRRIRTKTFAINSTLKNEISVNDNSVMVQICDRDSSFCGTFVMMFVSIDQRLIDVLEIMTPLMFSMMLRIRTTIKKKILTKREKEILSFISMGMNREMIADNLGISLRRVGQVLKSVAEKLDTFNTFHAINEAQIEGII